MAQLFNLENDLQQTVDFSTVGAGEFFIYSNEVYLRIDNNNPNCARVDTGETDRLIDSDQVSLPNSALLKLE